MLDISIPTIKLPSINNIVIIFAFLSLVFIVWKYLKAAYIKAQRINVKAKKKLTNPIKQIALINTNGFFVFNSFSMPKRIKGNATATPVKWLNQRYQVIQPENAYAIPVILLARRDAPKHLMYA